MNILYMYIVYIYLLFVACIFVISSIARSLFQVNLMFNYAIIEIFVTVSPVFHQLVVTELLGNKVQSSFRANLVPLNFEFGAKNSSCFNVVYISLIFVKLDTLKN